MIKLWARGDGETDISTCTLTLKAHEKAVTAGCWLGTACVATGSDDHSIVLWDIVKRSGNRYRYN